MKKIDLYISNEAPNVKRGAAWLRPVSGGFELSVLNNGWEPLKVAGVSEIVPSLVGTVQDAKTAATINGAKAFATDKAETLLGTASDVSTDMTLHGLKAYIDAQIAALG